MEKVLYLSIVAGSISFSVTETKLFKPVREWVKGNSSFFGELISCGYCFGHWVALGPVAVYRPRLLESWWPVDYFLTALIIAWLSGFYWAVMCWLTDKIEK